jgi:hypothetical protein
MQHYKYRHRVLRSRKHAISRCNLFANLYRSSDACTSGLAAAIFDIQLPVSTSILADSAIKFSDPKNMQIAVGISLLSCIEAEIRYIRFGAAILNIGLSVSRWSFLDIAIEFPDPETWVTAGTSLLSCIEAETQVHPV